jgi:hypothetical protein
MRVRLLHTAEGKAAQGHQMPCDRGNSPARGYLWPFGEAGIYAGQLVLKLRRRCTLANLLESGYFKIILAVRFCAFGSAAGNAATTGGL